MNESTGTPPQVSDRIWTVPNVLSFLRLLGVPVFLWLIVAHHDYLAIALLGLASLTDLLDGYIARRFNQMSRLGQMLDPAADRLYILATLVGLVYRGIVPWWCLAILLARDVMLTALVPLLRRKGYSSLPVNFIGKAGTFCLLYALPLILLGASDLPFALIADLFGWAFAIWGAVLYWYAGILYVRQTFALVRADA